MDRLGQALQRADRESSHVAVLFVDLDNFKVINDSLGHAAGDAVLSEVAERIKSCLRVVDTAARLGGDEFTVLLEGVSDPAEAVQVAERIRRALSAPVHLARQDVFAAASIGIALSSRGGDLPEDLVRRADLAMYRAKTSGKAQSALFDASLNALAQERLALETDLRLALERNELCVYYQPIVSLADDCIEGVEALVRWAHPERGMIQPSEFIPLAEETGLIVPLGQWVLEEACRQVREWQRVRRHLRLSVNLSARQFQHPDLVADVARALEQSGLEPAALTLEITETAVMVDAEDAVTKLTALRAMDIRLAIDDFGTGYSSLSYLTRFPVDTLKIDRGFVSGIERDPHNVAIVRSVLALAEGLNLSVTGEGIETSEQKAVLYTLGCQRGQGYLFSKPLSAADASELLLNEVRALPAWLAA
jgi:diguanylate cyclase (GGDEF)-like protein